MKGSALKSSATLLACVLFLLYSSNAFAAYVVVEPGTRPIGVAPPVAPTSAAECDEFAEQVSMWSNELNKRHDACLKAESRKGSSGRSHQGACTYARCENLHNAMSSLTSASSKEVLQCREQVVASRTQMQDELNALGSWEAAQARVQQFAPAAVKQMRSLAEKKLMEQLRGLAPDKVVFDATRASAKIAEEMVAARNLCMRSVTNAQRIECEKQAYVTVMRLQTLAPLVPNTSPVIKKIQSDAFSRLNGFNEATLRRLQALSQVDESDYEEEDSGQSIGK